MRSGSPPIVFVFETAFESVWIDDFGEVAAFVASMSPASAPGAPVVGVEGPGQALVSGNRARGRAKPSLAQNLVRAPRRLCAGTTKAGAPCPSAGLRDGYCYWHSPNVTEAQKMASRRKGGLYTAMSIPDAPDPKLRDPETITAFLDEIAGRVLRGEITPAMGAVLKGIADSSLRAYEASLARRLADLEKLVADRAQAVGPVRLVRE
jgi:hypothetical protein